MQEINASPLPKDKRFDIYGGGFIGVTMPAFKLSAIYTSFNGGDEAIFMEQNFTPTLFSGGLDAGMQIYFYRKYSLGVEYNFVAYGKTADNVHLQTEGGIVDATPPDIADKIELRYSNDLLLTLGVLAGTSIHLKAKAGVSYLQYRSQVSIFNGVVFNGVQRDTNIFPKEFKNLTGAVIALNFTYELTKTLNFFIEYAYHTYKVGYLRTIEGVSPIIGFANATLTQRKITLRANSVRFGFNFNLYTI